MIKEFKEFIARGNVIDLAVGIIIGAAFTAIVSSLVSDIINPIIGLITGGTDFSSHYFVLKGEVPPNASLEVARQSGASIFAWGSFISAIINFLIIAWVVFMLVKGVNKIQTATARKKVEEEAAAPAGPSQEELLMQIRDELRANRA
ncbi:large conductance mechanosensitive channel protein MscL [Paracoccus sulfuroxidans]|uniref:Large-conductance mechanosensitive channel n=1 Tax=Paracoccus sulfuroxidans TaxID=384678 RepID=A0A562NR11_9RHOB|nr:large conductance mechanosensitive channel protein MscL [Paracoccus sulfuroxidans]TWI34481.1 large conductance mechanosensitive channel [Paracoccus sulfuroxidans]